MFKRNGGNGGERKYGGRSGGYGDRGGFGGRSGGYGVRDDARPQLHKATCAGCGDQCEVPFKPNGSKPIFCRNCFKKDDNAAPKRFDRPSFDRPSYGDKRPAFKSFGDRPQTQPDISRIEARLAAIEAKIDALIEALLAEGEDEEDDAEEADAAK